MAIEYKGKTYEYIDGVVGCEGCVFNGKKGCCESIEHTGVDCYTLDQMLEGRGGFVLKEGVGDV